MVYAPLLLLCMRGLSANEQRTLRNMLMIGFALRVLASTIFAIVPETRVFHEDAAGTEWLSIRVASYWMHDGLSVPDWEVAERNYGLIYFFGGLLYVVGRYPLNITIFNSFIGTLNALLVYRIGIALVEPRVARRAAKYMAFFPSMIIWSSIALKDPLMTCCICVTLLSAIHLRRRFSLIALAGCLAPMLVAYPIRFYLVYFMAASLVGTIALGREGEVIGGISKQLALLVGLGIIVVAFGFSGNAMSDMEYFDLAKVSSYRHGMAATANSAFAADVDISSPGKALAFLPIGVSTLVFGPFPWQMTSLRPLLSAPEMIVWWSLAPSLVRGFWFALTRQFRLFAPLIVFSTIALAGYSLTLGNLGAAYRMRAQVFGFLFLFAALGQYLKKVRDRGIDESLLLADGATAEPRRPARARALSPAKA